MNALGVVTGGHERVKGRGTRRRILAAVPAGLVAAQAAGSGPGAAAPADWATSQAGAAAAHPPLQGLPGATQAVYFPETGHHLRTGFLAHWRAHEGPGRLGPPLTEEHWDAGYGAMVQHFPLGRLEWRSAAPDTVGEVPGPPASALGRAPVPRDFGAPDWAVALAPPAPVIAVSPTQVRQGRAVLIELRLDDPAVPLSVTGAVRPPGQPGDGVGASLRLFPAPAGGPRFLALAGVAINAPLGPWDIVAGGRNGLGLESAPGTGSLQVVDGGFPVQRLAFAAELIPLLEPQVGVQELLTLAAVMADGAPAPLWRGRFLQPVSGTLVTSHGARRDYLDPAGQTVSRSQHSGVDLGAPFGTPIAAPADGVVAFAGTWSIRGNVVVLDHGAGVHSVHAHASSIAVTHGQRVARGQVLGRVGSTGLSTGPHLHWEVRVGGVAVDPLEWTQRAELGLS